MISIPTNVVPPLVDVDPKFEAFVWVGDLANFIFVVDEESSIISTSSDTDSIMTGRSVP
jgi:hypothetical protein